VENMKLFYALAAIFQVLVILRFMMRKNKEKRPAESETKTEETESPVEENRP